MKARRLRASAASPPAPARPAPARPRDSAQSRARSAMTTSSGDGEGSITATPSAGRPWSSQPRNIAAPILPAPANASVRGQVVMSGSCRRRAMPRTKPHEAELTKREKGRADFVAKVTRFLYRPRATRRHGKAALEFRARTAGSQGRKMAQNARILAALALIGGFAAGGIALARGPDMNLQIFAPSSEPSFSFEPRPGPRTPPWRTATPPVARPHHKHTPPADARRSDTASRFACGFATASSSRRRQPPAAMRPAPRNAPTRQPRSTRCRPNTSRTPSPRRASFIRNFPSPSAIRPASRAPARVIATPSLPAPTKSCTIRPCERATSS